MKKATDKHKGTPEQRQALYTAVIQYENSKADLKHAIEEADMFTPVHAQRYSHIGTRQKGTGDPTAKSAAAIEAMKEDKRRALAAYRAAGASLTAAIKDCPDEDIRAIITERYIKEKTWQATAWNALSTTAATTATARLSRYFNNGERLPESISILDF